MSVWRKAENDDGIAYYINEKTQAVQWDHPEYSQVKQAIDDHNYIVYPAYRLAAKFTALQKYLYIDNIPVSVIAGVFEKHRLGNNESTLALECYDLEAVLSDIYFAANKMSNINVNVDFATELMMCFLYNIFDSKRQKSIQVFSAKLILGVVSKATSHDLYKFLFNLCCDHNNCVTRIKLRNLLLKFCEVTKYLHENDSFGAYLVDDAVEECFKSSPGLVGVTESTFVTWLESGPKILSWIPILHRIRMAETVVHSGKCSTCNTEPLWGLKYECVKCSRYTQCQQCFLAGSITRSHKLSHIVREYCSNDSNRVSEDTEHYFTDESGCNKHGKSVDGAVDGQPFMENQTKSNLQYGIDDMSTWIGGMPQTPTNHIPTNKSTFISKSPVKILHNDLDEALAKLQQILANNFALEESSLGITDNAHLKTAVTEVEGMLTSIIDNVEISRCTSAQPIRLKFESRDLVKTPV